MFKFIKRFFGLDYNENVSTSVAEDYYATKAGQEVAAKEETVVAAPVEPVAEKPAKKPRKPAAKKAAPKKAAKPKK